MSPNQRLRLFKYLLKYGSMLICTFMFCICNIYLNNKNESNSEMTDEKYIEELQRYFDGIETLSFPEAVKEV